MLPPVGFRAWLGIPESGTPTLQAGLFDAPSGGYEVVSPGTYRGLLTLAGYSPNQLPAAVSRAEAMQVPALNNGVRILTSIAAQLPLVANPVEPSRLFLSELDPTVAPGWTVAKTVDSLIFHGVAYWYVTSRTDRGFPRTVQFVALERIQVDDKAETVRLDNVPVSPNDVIRFNGLTEGVLACGAEAIRTAAANIRQVRRYAENPRPGYILRDRDNAEPLDPAEARDILTALNDSITSHGVAYMAGLDIEAMGWDAKNLMLVEARQQDAIDMARLLAVPVKYVAATEGAGSSLTYANLGEIRRDLWEVGGLAQYAVPIQQRLSMPDVTPRGTVVRFDADSFFLQTVPDQPDPAPAQDQANTPDQGAP
jgi:hypothetical protein